MAHNRSVLKERRIPPGGPHLCCGGGVLGLALGIGASTGLRGPGPALAGKLEEGEAFGVPQRGTGYQPGVKPRVCSTNGAF